ncbi:unnamed protein product [Allacma fusca]|uniref:Uncharacterized protein n=1 Tax=Allacma fusca TaxID=39272 RepID=A0A8J2KS32_9HEXA|nr:unnamed protein product [Allacma fusca]
MCYFPDVYPDLQFIRGILLCWMVSGIFMDVVLLRGTYECKPGYLHMWLLYTCLEFATSVIIPPIAQIFLLGEHGNVNQPNHFAWFLWVTKEAGSIWIVHTFKIKLDATQRTCTKPLL